ncbi:hypothetical protein ECG_01317 [Echinococcus granulosus]|nr:hypothetical protein ECG_01317 [Echinococcus granulosus]
MCVHCAVSNHSFAVSNSRYCAGCCRAFSTFLPPSLSRLGLCTVGVAWVRAYDTCGGNRYTLVIRERSRLHVTISCAIFRALSIVTQFVDIQMCCVRACEHKWARRVACSWITSYTLLTIPGGDHDRSLPLNSVGTIERPRYWPIPLPSLQPA